MSNPPNTLLADMERTTLRIGILHLVLLTLVFPIHGASLCAPECACYHGNDGQYVSCRHQNLNNIPKNIPEDTIELDLGHNNIPVLDKSSFPHMPQLRRLILDNCKVKSIGEATFSHLASLDYLKLSENSISHVHSSAFRGLSRLRRLHLNNNQIQTLSEALFRELILDELFLHANEIQTLEDRVFEGSSIVNLNLDANNISNISMELFTPLKTSLKNFNLSHNEQPLKLDADVFSGFNFSDLRLSYDGLKDSSFLRYVQTHSLDISGHHFTQLNFTECYNFRIIKEIYLRNLNIEELNGIILSNFESITLLDLSDNLLFAIDGTVFKYTPKLRALRLDLNSFISLPENLGIALGNLEVLKITENKLAMVRPDAFEGMDKIKELDLRYNNIQVIDKSMQTILTKIDTVMLGNNPLHCNCEMRWYKDWLEITRKNTGGFQCFSPQVNNIFSMSSDEFVCRAPTIKYVTNNMNVMNGESVFLTCRAEGDPAPEVEWTSPFGEIVSVTPPFNRTRYTTLASWQVNMQLNMGGWFTCSASNREGDADKSMYINVYPPDGSTIDVDILTMPTTTPLTTTTTTTTTPPSTTTTTTSTTPPPTTTTTTTTTAPITTPTTTISTTLNVTRNPEIPPTTTVIPEAQTSEITRTTAHTTSDMLTDNNTTIKPWVVGVITGSLLGTILIVTFIGVCVHNYYKRKNGKYDVGRIYYNQKDASGEMPLQNNRV